MPKEPRETLTTACEVHLAMELTARAMEWEHLATKLQQRANAWGDEATRWAGRRDSRTTICSLRVQWVAEQTHQLAAAFRLAADHLFALSTGGSS